MVDYHGFLHPSDGVDIFFWIIFIAMVQAIAKTVFFLMYSMNVNDHWKTWMKSGAAVHYFCMREN